MFQVINRHVQHVLHPSLRFIWSDLMNDAGRRYTLLTVLLVLAGSATSIIGPYGLGIIVDGVTKMSWEIFLHGLFFYAMLRLTENLLYRKRLQVRERVFQQNFWCVPQRLTELFVRQPLGTYINTDNALDGGGVESVQNKVLAIQSNFLFTIIPNWSLVIFGLLVIVWIHWLLGLVVACYVVVETCTSHKHNEHIRIVMDPVAEEFRTWLKRIRAHWDAIALVKTNGVEQSVIQAVHDEVQAPLQVDDRLWRVWFANALFARRSINLVVSLALCTLAAKLSFAGSIAVEHFVLLIFSFQRVTSALEEVADTQRDVQRGLAQIETYRVQLVKPSPLHYKVGGEFSESEIGIRFDKISLTLGTNGAEREILRDVSCTINPGERVGIVGPSGAGKTQLTNLILRVHNADAGSLWCGATNLRSVAPQSWLAHVGNVPQEPTVFDASIRYNVRFAVREHTNESDDELVWEALRRAGLNLTGRLTNGLDTVLGTKGLRLSGGQRQRLVIAQAIYKVLCCERAGRPQLVVADEATSALDSISEAHVLDSLYAALPVGTTMLMIAHRLSSLYGCDSILMVRPLEHCPPGVKQVTKHTSLWKLYEEEPLFREMAKAQGFVPQ